MVKLPWHQIIQEVMHSSPPQTDSKNKTKQKPVSFKDVPDEAIKMSRFIKTQSPEYRNK